MYEIDPNDEIGKSGKAGSDAAANTAREAMAQLSNAWQKQIPNATIDGRSAPAGVMIVPPVLWYFYSWSVHAALSPMILIAVGVLIVLISTRISSYGICIGNAVVAGFFAGFAADPIAGLVIGLVVAIALLAMTSFRNLRFIGQILVGLISVLGLLCKAGVFTLDDIMRFIPLAMTPPS